MPQLAPLSWLLLSFFLFLFLFSFCSSIWWLKKNNLVLDLRSEKVVESYFWVW